MRTVDDSVPFEFGPITEVYLAPRTRALLRSRRVTSAEMLCRMRNLDGSERLLAAAAAVRRLGRDNVRNRGSCAMRRTKLGSLEHWTSRSTPGPPAPARPPAIAWSGLRIAGNEAVAAHVQPKLAVSRPGDASEREADWAADQVMRTPDGEMQRAWTWCSGAGPGDASCERERDISIQPKTATATAPAIPDGLSGSLGPGAPLDGAARAFLEPRFGRDFGDVRIHTGAEAGAAAEAIDARAFTLGRDIAFAPGQYAPGTTGGRHLLAHELAHTLQQRAGDVAEREAGAIQRQEASAVAPVTARTIFPFPGGSRVVLNRIMPQRWFDMLSRIEPEIGAALGAIESQVATVTSATDDLFEATLAGSITLPARGGNAAGTLSNVTLSLRRTTAGTFDFELSGRTAPDAEPSVLFGKRNLTAGRREGAIVLTSGTEPELRIVPGASSEERRIETYTAPYLSQVPDIARAFVPERLALIQVTRLPEVRAGTGDEHRAIAEVASRVRGERTIPRQRVLGGAGAVRGAAWAPLLTASWQITFRPAPALGDLLRVPLELQVQYAPSASVLGSISSGAELSLAQLNVPINVRLVTGVGGGALEGGAPAGTTERPVLPAFGPTLGAGVGLELGAFRADVRYEHLFNLVRASPNADAVFVRLGAAF